MGTTARVAQRGFVIEKTDEPAAPFTSVKVHFALASDVFALAMTVADAWGLVSCA